MPCQRIGAVTIGQCPRPDLVAPLQEMLPACDILQAGALDGFTAADLPDPATGRYPLTTRLADGTAVTVSESFLAPRLQQAVARLEAEDVRALVLLCAGTFADLHSRVPLFNPTTYVSHLLHSAGVTTIGVVCPFSTQRTAAADKWRQAGFTPVVWVTAPENPAGHIAYHVATHPEIACVVLDYVGHTAAQVKAVQAAVHLPVFDLGYATLAAVASTFNP